MSLNEKIMNYYNDSIQDRQIQFRKEQNHQIEVMCKQGHGGTLQHCLVNLKRGIIQTFGLNLRLEP